MNRLVTDNPQNNMEIMTNLAFVKNKEVWIRGGGPDGEDCTLVDFSKQMCMKNHECQFDDGFPADLAKGDSDSIGDLFMECSMSGCPIGTAYFIAIQAAELRERLKELETEIEHLKRPDCEHAEHDGIGCLGYCGCTQDDEPIESCKRCEKYTGNVYEEARWE